MERPLSRRVIAAVAVLIAWTVLLTYLSSLWTRRQFEVPPAWDHALYLSMSLRFHRALRDEGGGALAREVLHRASPVAPLFPITTVPFYRTFGESREVAQLTLAPYLFLLLLATALLSSGLGANASTMVLSVFLISTFTGVVNFSREYMMDLPAAATATLSLAVLSRRGPGLLPGFLAGIALLTKVLAGVFFVGPLIYFLIREDRRKVLLFGAAALLTAGIWYAPHLADILGYIRYYGFGEGSLPFRSSSHPGYYARVLVTQGIGWMPFAVLGIALLLGSRRARPDALLLVWIASGYALLTILPNKGGERYVLALLPPLAVLGAIAISGVETRAARGALVGVALAASVLNYAGITWNSELSAWTHNHHNPFPHAMPLEEHERRGWPTTNVLETLGELRESAFSSSGLESFVERTRGLEDGAFVDETYRSWLGREADPEGRKAYMRSLQDRSRVELVESVLDSEEFRARPLRVLVVPDHRVFNAATLQYLAESDRLPLSFRRVARGDDEADAALIKEGGPQGPWPDSLTSSETVRAIEKRASEATRFPCPDGSRVLVMRLQP